MRLQTLPCPSCGLPLAPRKGVPTKVDRFTDCLRQCWPCKVGYSNGKNTPIVIWAQPHLNVPAEVRDGLEGALARAVSLVNRANKAAQFGFATSEDAVTWTVFRYLLAKGALGAAARACGHAVHDGATPRLLLWGGEVPAQSTGSSHFEEALARISKTLGESDSRRTEPDVVLDFGDSGVVFVEAKLRSGNDQLDGSSSRWTEYLTAGFSNPVAARESGLYELSRNWRFAFEMAAGRPFTLVNLGPPTLADARLERWKSSLDMSIGGRFVQLTWPELLDVTPLEPWLATFCEERRIVDSSF